MRYDKWPDDTLTEAELHSLVPLAALSRISGDWPDLDGYFLCCDFCHENEVTALPGAEFLAMYELPDESIVCEQCRCKSAQRLGIEL